MRLQPCSLTRGKEQRARERGGKQRSLVMGFFSVTTAVPWFIGESTIAGKFAPHHYAMYFCHSESRRDSLNGKDTVKKTKQKQVPNFLLSYELISLTCTHINVLYMWQ